MKLLVVEDDESVGQFLEQCLPAEGFIVDRSTTGTHGSLSARTQAYDAIVLDYTLPGKDGLTVCHEIRDAGISTPIMMLTAKSSTSDKITCFEAGADDYLTKPFSFQEFVARTNALIRRPKALLDHQLTIDDLMLDRSRYTVTRADKAISLTQKEFMLLECLMVHSGTVVSRGALLEEVWDSSVNPFSNTIETHMTNLRRKIDGTSPRKLIQTIRGRGYKIESPHHTGS